MKKISFIIPCFNEEGNVKQLSEALKTAPTAPTAISEVYRSRRGQILSVASRNPFGLSESEIKQ